ncbi:MAG TPA: HD domain-containing protein [Bacillota bacterium]|nr:HD domain-containing protein [Bacillota bacterium]
MFKELNTLVKNIADYSCEIFQHSYNVSTIAACFANCLKLPEKEVFIIKTAGLLHDIGKTEIDIGILNKPEKLSAEEWKIIKKHPEIGVRILTPYPWARSFLPLINYHHERWDGNGYYGVPGFKIPLGARLLALADAFEAMSSDRPYQESKNLEESLEELELCSGSQFEPFLVEKFTRFSNKIINLINRQKQDGAFKIEVRSFNK